MEDQDFKEGLKDEKDIQQQWLDAAEAWEKMKFRSERPATKEKTAGILDQLKDPTLMIPAALFAAGGAALAHQGNKPRPELNGRSQNEATGQKTVDAQTTNGEEGQGYLRKLLNRQNETASRTATTMREHPRASILHGALLGAGAGFGAGKLLGGGINLVKKLRKP